MLYTGILSQRETHRGMALDITVRDKTVLSPTWELVTRFNHIPRAQRRANSHAWREYTAGYTDLLRQRYRANPAPFLALIQDAERSDLTLCCLCHWADEQNPVCHRFLARDISFKIALAHHRAIDPALGHFEIIALTGKSPEELVAPPPSPPTAPVDRKSHR